MLNTPVFELRKLKGLQWVVYNATDDLGVSLRGIARGIESIIHTEWPSKVKHE